MKIFREYSQCQGLLFPPSRDEFVPEHHEARIVNEVVDTTDLSPLLGKHEGGGAPAYHSAVVLKVIVYAYSRDTYGSRSIAQELKTDTVFMFLSGMQSPDFQTPCLFRSEHAEVLPDLYVQGGEAVRLFRHGGVGAHYLRWHQAKGKCPVGQTRDRDGLEKEIERMKEQMQQMTQTSTNINEL